MKMFISFSFAVTMICFLARTDASTQAGRRSSNDDGLSRKKRSSCFDISGTNCYAWRRQGYCNYYRNYCQKTCGFCKVGVPLSQVCRDKKNACSSYSYHYCTLSQYKVWFRTNCPKKCGYCVTKPMPMSCVDKNKFCNSWAATGECKKNPAYMKVNCKKSCGICVTTTRKPVPKTRKPIPKTTKPIPKTRKPTPKTTKPTPKTTKPTPKTTKPMLMTTAKPKPVCGIRGLTVGRIVGGRYALPGDWPWHVAIKTCRNCSKLPFCGATLINDEWIVTAAHCVEYWLPSDLHVIIGDTNLQRKSGYEVTVGLKSMFIHNDYAVAAAYDNDVALLRLKSPVTFSRYIKPACLASSSMPAGTTCTVTGFGRISENGPKSPKLQQASVPLVDAATCKKAYTTSAITANMLCAGHAQGGIDACRGDSGGPLMCKKFGGPWQLSGIVSWGIGCARKDKYGVYTDVQVVRAWIEKTIAKETSAVSTGK